MRIPIDTSPGDVGAILQASFQKSFFDFAYPFIEADLSQRWKPGITTEDIKQVMRALKALPNKILKPLLDCESLLELSDSKSHLKDEYSAILERVKDEYHLRDFIASVKVLQDKLKNAHHDLGLLSKGRPVSPRTYIIMGWAYLMLGNGRKVDWGLMESLYEWYWNRLKNYHYYNWLKPPDEAYFHIQYRRYRDRYQPAPKARNLGWRILLFGKNYLQDENTFPRLMRPPVDMITRSLDLLEMIHNEPGLTRKMLQIYKREIAFDPHEVRRTLPLLVVFPDYSYWIETPA